MPPMTEFNYPNGLEIVVDFEMQVREVAAWAELQHSDDAEFHHFPHALEVYSTCMELADEFEASGTVVNRRNLAFAAIGHDILAHVPLSTEIVPGQIFESKEHRSAWLLYNYLISRGYDEASVAQPVYDLVVSTKRDEPCNTTESIILGMADVYNTQEFEVFEERAQAFHRETCLFEGKDCSFADWLPGAMVFLEGFLDKLPDPFADFGRANIQRLRDKYLTS